MSQACRTICRKNSTSRAGNMGLVLAMHLRTTGDKDTGKRDLFKLSGQVLSNSVDVYGAAYSRWKEATTGTIFRDSDLSVTQRLVVGLGSKGVLAPRPACRFKLAKKGKTPANSASSPRIEPVQQARSRLN